MTKIDKITKAAATDGYVSSSEMRGILLEIMADGTVSKREFQAFCALLNSVSGHIKNTSLLPLVAKIVASVYFLEDGVSPGVFTAEGLQQFEGQIAGDGKIDAVEQDVHDFLHMLALKPGETLDETILHGDLAAKMASLVAYGSLDDTEIKSLYFRIADDGQSEDIELAGLVEIHLLMTDVSDLWNQIFPVLLARAVGFDLDDESANVLKGLGTNGFDAVGTAAIEGILELAVTDETGFGEWFRNQKAA